jgi:hypothetical protein
MSEPKEWPKTDMHPGETIIVDTVTVHMTRKDAEWWSVWPFGEGAIQMQFYDRIKLSTKAALGDSNADIS